MFAAAQSADLDRSVRSQVWLPRLALLERVDATRSPGARRDRIPAPHGPPNRPNGGFRIAVECAPASLLLQVIRGQAHPDSGAFGLGGECACNQASGWRHKRGGTPPAEPRNHHKASTTAAPNAPIPSAVPVNAMFEGSSMNC
jgi:hypothetical protein